VPRDPFKPHDQHLEQGDIFSDVPLIKWKSGKLVQKPGRAIITAHGCACEDYERAVDAGRTQAAEKLVLHVAPLRQTQGVPEHRLDEIRSGEQLDYFYIYGTPNKLTDQLLDLTYEQPVPAHVLEGCTKIARIADWQWRRLLVHQTVSRFHQKPETIFLANVLAQGGGVAAT
jgi:xanthine dehydrogenase iron-sulfur cluster and FAD-binding subunit A